MTILRILSLCLLFMNAFSISLRSEPESLLSNTCSKFDFEERVLEKLVRLEHKIEIYEDKAKRWDNSIVSKLEKMDEALKQSKTFTDSVQAAQQQEQLRLNKSYSEIVDSFKNRMDNETEFYGQRIDNLLKSFSLKIHELTEAEKTRENYIELMQLTFLQEQKRFNQSFDQMGETIKAISNRTIQELFSGRKVAMAACVSSDDTKPSDTVIKFDDVLIQVGINNIASFRTSGEFTSEVKGLYLTEDQRIFAGDVNNVVALTQKYYTQVLQQANNMFRIRTEYENGNLFANGANDEDAPCALCRSTNTTSTIMIPGRITCDDGWKMEYHGILASGAYNHKPSSYICLDSNPEFLQAGKDDKNGHLLYATTTKCGSLACPPYVDKMAINCVVCSK
ncbi:Hypothetical predicted protein [Mytilus galloprovincialis]|uniref:Uncharacterized protein n=1 Tax=Mytilus galloprovincialis TaxID=29158 RepID=A0A8B6DZH1_MYTGA|nr:Hypothetical predicted protein [Mytilus galloprovincialis]